MHTEDAAADSTVSETSAVPVQRTSRRAAWLLGVLLLAGAGFAAVWGFRTLQAERAIATVERSVADRPPPAAGAAPAVAPQRATVPPVSPPYIDEPPAVATAPAADRLPALQLPGQPVPDAVLRDLPDWVTAEVAPKRAVKGAVRSAAREAPAPTSGGSGDESAAVAPVVPGQPARAAPKRDRYGSVFARCPGPGESGAVECRRAVCSGGARKAAACAPYRE